MDMTPFEDEDYPPKKNHNISNFIPPLPVILDEIRGFKEHLVISLEEAMRLAIEYFRINNLLVDSYLLSDLIRYHTKRLMKAQADLDLFEEYNVDDKLANNGLAAHYKGYHIRILKSRSDGELIPNSHTKASFFCQQLVFDINSLFPILLPNAKPNIILFWNIDDKYTLLPLRFVCPKYGVFNKNLTQVYYDEVLSDIIDYSVPPTNDSDDLNITKKDEKPEIKEDKTDTNDEDEQL
jgi:hypothetical protein